MRLGGGIVASYIDQNTGSLPLNDRETQGEEMSFNIQVGLQKNLSFEKINVYVYVGNAVESDEARVTVRWR